MTCSRGFNRGYRMGKESGSDSGINADYRYTHHFLETLQPNIFLAAGMRDVVK